MKHLFVVQITESVAPASMAIYDFVPDDDWSEGEVNIVLSMQGIANELVMLDAMYLE